jgi:hypothetical protein
MAPKRPEFVPEQNRCLKQRLDTYQVSSVPDPSKAARGARDPTPDFWLAATVAASVSHNQNAEGAILYFALRLL